MLKRLCLIGLTMILLASMMFQPMPSMAASGDWQSAAEYLYELGLFRGTGTSSDGTPVFELERSPTRTEALVMLLRLMGLEQEALNSSYSHPFTDVSGWSEPYIAYAYNKGITKGISQTRFGSNDKATASMYATFVLRALGYTDSGDSPDFSYSGSVSFAVKIGLVDSRLLNDNEFTRGDVAVISKNALSQPLRNSSKTLFQRLADEGIIKDAPNQGNGDKPGQDDEKTDLTVPVKHHIDYGTYIPRQTLLSLFPKMDKVLYTTTTEEDFTDPYGVKVSDRYGFEELMFIDALANEKIYVQYGSKSGDMVRLFPGSTLYLADSSCNILARCTVPEKNITEITFSLKAGIDGAMLNSEYRKIVDTVSENWGKNLFELSKEQYKSQDGKSSSVHLVKMNGEYVSDDWYCAIWEYSPGFERDLIGDAEYAIATPLSCFLSYSFLLILLTYSPAIILISEGISSTSNIFM